MRRLAYLAVTAAIASGCAMPAAPTPTSSSSTTSTAAIVDHIADGDTLTTRAGDRIRLVQIDAPEVASNECGNELATATLRRLAPPGSRITLEADPALDDVDRYGRLLRYVRLPDGRLANLELVRAGAAAPYFYRAQRGAHADQLDRAARAARSGHRGAWGTCPRAELATGRAWSTSP